MEHIWFSCCGTELTILFAGIGPWSKIGKSLAFEVGFSR
jgi:hypothetical protein